MTLYLVVMDNKGTGENSDVFVRASIEREAIKFALKHFDVKREEVDDVIRVFEVPSAEGPKGAICWSGMGVQQSSGPVDRS